MDRIKSLLREILPPVFLRVMKKLFRSGIVFKGNYSTWEEAVKASSGYDQLNILEKTKNSTLKVKLGEEVYERDSVIFDHIEYSLPVLSGIMLAAAKDAGRLSVLDFGGSLGSSYYQNRKFLNLLPNVLWGIVEQPHYVNFGREFIQDERLRFFDSIEDCEADLRPNVVLLGSVLHYLSNPFKILDYLKMDSINFLIIDRTPFSKLKLNKISVQTVPSSIYKASYPCWIFSRRSFEEIVGQNWQLIEEFECGKDSTMFDFSFQGLIYQRIPQV